MKNGFNCKNMPMNARSIARLFNLHLFTTRMMENPTVGM